MNYLDINPSPNSKFRATLGGVSYKFSLLWSDVNGWLMSISKNVDGNDVTLGSCIAMRLNVDCFEGLGESVALIPRFEEPDFDNIGKTCYLEVVTDAV
ncbi:TPA: hypothetical protein JG819_004709 [Vibrio parahaemolyticus]|nr:hypothetical protein [Vibrio parahaemolyticus]HAV1545609.1 hypothetical protein [Vibrio parahaemolyticus]